MLEIKEFVGHKPIEIKDASAVKKTADNSTKNSTKKTKDK